MRTSFCCWVFALALSARSVAFRPASPGWGKVSTVGQHKHDKQHRTGLRSLRLSTTVAPPPPTQVREGALLCVVLICSVWNTSCSHDVEALDGTHQFKGVKITPCRRRNVDYVWCVHGGSFEFWSRAAHKQHAGAKLPSCRPGVSG